MARMDTARATPQAPPCPLPPPIQKSNAQCQCHPIPAKSHAPARVARVGGPGCQGCRPDGRQVGSILCSEVWGVRGYEGVWGGQDVPTAGKCKLHALVVCHACCSLFSKLPHAASRTPDPHSALSAAPFEVLFRIAGARFAAFLSWRLCRARPQIEANRIVMEDPVDRRVSSGSVTWQRLHRPHSRHPCLTHSHSKSVANKGKVLMCPSRSLRAHPLWASWHQGSSYLLDSVRGSVRAMPSGP